MKKIQIALICLACIMLLAGCGDSKPAEIDLEDKLKNIEAESKEKDTEENKPDKEKPEKTKKKKKSDKRKTPEEDPQGDTPEDTDYEAVYAPVFDEVLEVLDYGFNIDREYNYVSGGLSEKVMYSEDDDLFNSIGYLLTDMSGDGIPELLIGSDEKFEDRTCSYIYTLCSIIDENPVCMIAGSTRSSYNFMGDGHFYYEGSMGASVTIFGENHLSRDGSELVWDDFYFSDEKEDGGVGVYYNNTGIFDIGESEELDISEKEFAGKMSKYRDRCVTLSWTPIGKYRGDGNTDNDEQTGNREQITDDDPLEGLVSNDILVKFRESNSVKDPESVENEALMLGRWVQKNIGKIPKSVREKGDEIGRRYEFWFGTDVGNNFDSNFPMIYEAYYCLKDYYTSDGKRSRDFYERVSEGNDFLSNGDPENIEKMFSDMRDFITDCNNIIRKK